MDVIEQSSRPPAENPPALTPPPIVEWGLIIAGIVAGIRYLGKWYLDQASAKEKNESELMRGLIDNLQTVQGQLIKDSKEAKLELISHIDLKDTMSRMSTLLKDDVGRALGAQGAMYAKGLENQTRMEGKLDASLRQGDRIIELLEKMLEKLDDNDS